MPQSEGSGVKEGERESNSDTETILRDFMRTKLKIPPEDVKEIHLHRVHIFLTKFSVSLSSLVCWELAGLLPR